MNRKMFSLVTSLAILSSSLSPTWAVGKDFTYYELNKNLPTKAEVKSVENAEEKQSLPLVREDMPDDSVKDKYMRIIFVPETSLVNGVQNYGKLIDKEGKDVPIVETSYKIYSKVFSVKGKEYYVLKDARWSDVLRYKENDKLIFSTRKADNNEVETEKRNNHSFLDWKY